MSDEPYSPGGEHCPKCGYRHDGRCEEKRQQFIKRCESFYAKSGFTLGPVAGWDARQPEIDALRDFARDLWDYAQVQWKGTRQYDVALAEARKLGIVDGPSEAQEDEREGQMLAEQWREHEQQTRP